MKIAIYICSDTVYNRIVGNNSCGNCKGDQMMKNLGIYTDRKTGKTGIITAETTHYYIVKWDKPDDYDYEQVVKPEYEEEFTF